MRTPSNTVLLIIPPFASVDYPMIGPSLLASSCRRMGIDVKMLYTNLELAGRIGYRIYQKISLSSFSIMAGELLFRDTAFPEAFENCKSTFNTFFSERKGIHVSSPHLGMITHEDIIHCTENIPSFLADITKTIVDLAPSIVGISSVFQQNLAAISMARHIRDNLPSSLIVLGGANASSPMGEALIRDVDAFDFVFSGEADNDFADFAKNYVEEGILPENNIIECVPIKSLDDIPYPDYSDYFFALKKLQNGKLLPAHLPTKLPIETSRGCWWGAKKHCTFCGLNGKEISFRNKSPQRILTEIEDLTETYKISSFQATDNIMPLNFQKEVLPSLARNKEKKEFFYEVKSNLKGSDLDLFCLAGVNSIQPGIESFSTNILHFIDKGVTGIQNLWLLRECLSRQIQVIWNILTGIPGDSLGDYTSTLDLVPAIEHLHPPQAVSRIVIDRYSPYHFNPSKYGIENIEALPAYASLYPRQMNLNDIAYHFSGQYDSAFLKCPEFATTFNSTIESKWIEKWIDSPFPPKLYAVPLDEERYFIEDTRECAIEQRVALDPETTRVLRSLSTPQRSIPADDAPFVSFLRERNFVISHEQYLMSIVSEPAIGFRLKNDTLQGK